MRGSSSGLPRAGWGWHRKSLPWWRFLLPTRRAMYRARPIQSTADEPLANVSFRGAAQTRTRNDNEFLHATGPPIMPVTLDPDASAVFKAFQEAGRPAYETLSPGEAREFYLAARVVTNPEPPELKSVAPLAIPSPAGPIPARLYTPIKPRTAEGLAPCLVFFH